ncbi:MAG: tetratricopeptide repeat protein [Alphaproteobacteria bacterium]|nr:tetratricopeptide repeat protein [Alphaproteobacteria bacterium]
MKITKSFVLMLGACAALSACQTIPSDGSSSSSLSASARGMGLDDENVSLEVAERRYKQKPEDERLAVDYARALREDNRNDQAVLVLEPFAAGKTPQSQTLSEYAAIQIALGDYKKAERFAQKAVVGDGNNYRAYHNLGMALEGQGKHPEAETALRKALELNQGDPTTVMNNLALNLASQGYLDESIDILRRAQALSPDRVEIERNVRIVTALQQTARGPTPTPVLKPKP